VAQAAEAAQLIVALEILEVLLLKPLVLVLQGLEMQVEEEILPQDMPLAEVEELQ
jgi:hypothetical protein